METIASREFSANPVGGKSDSTIHRCGHNLGHDSCYEHPAGAGCEGAHSKGRSGLSRPGKDSGCPRCEPLFVLPRDTASGGAASSTAVPPVCAPPPPAWCAKTRSPAQQVRPTTRPPALQTKFFQISPPPNAPQSALLPLPLVQCQMLQLGLHLRPHPI